MFKEGTEEEQKKDKLVVDVQVDSSSQSVHDDVGHDNNVDHEESTHSSESRHDSHESEDDMSTPPAHELRRSIRLHKPTQRYSPSLYYALFTDSGEPECFQEAKDCPEKAKWQRAIEDELDSLHQNHTWELVELPVEKKALKNRWVYVIKNEADGSKRYKARLVVKGYGQKQGIDFNEIFAPVVKHCSIRVVLSLVANLDLELEQLDIKTAFLHGDLDEEIYMFQPEGFVEANPNLVCKLKKGLYGLKQASRQWYKKFDSFMQDEGYKRCDFDHCVYFRGSTHDSFTILLLYVDDMLIASNDQNDITKLKLDMSKKFATKDLGEAKEILGMQIKRDREHGKLWLSQSGYISKVLERFEMNGCKPVSTPLAGHFKLSKKNSPKNEVERDKMKNVPYNSAVGSLIVTPQTRGITDAAYLLN
uniref:Reverse transcriptase Ty1/copia-type domain-containing protein n=1 Tax=Ananas comosus var. bracteatus TaxID=296719 RepID=A0A6V7Q1Z6_ANACO|nr:unnamed protein product [Ananas comosus var. bracteatus]